MLHMLNDVLLAPCGIVLEGGFNDLSVAVLEDRLCCLGAGSSTYHVIEVLPSNIHLWTHQNSWNTQDGRDYFICFSD